MYGRLGSGVQAKQERVNSLNFVNDTVLITDMFVSVVHPNTSNFGSGEPLHGVCTFIEEKSRIYKHSIRQHCPVEIRKHIAVLTLVVLCVFSV